MYSKEAIKLTKPCYEAIKKIAERQNCPRCKGKGYWDTPFLTCPTCNGIGKGKWEWEPEMGEFFLDDEGNLRLVALFEGGQIDDHEGFLHKPVEVILLLHWERIEEILEGMGWSKFQFGSWSSDGKIEASSYRTGEMGDGKILVCSAVGKSRQLAVMRAVIELAKEE